MLRALSRMTLTPTMIKGGIKSNSVPEVFELTCDVRTLPFQDEAYVRSQLDKVLEGIDNVEYDVDYMSVPNSSPFETELGVSNGFTDSRFTRNLGIVTYGFTGSHPSDDPMLAKVHGTDESVGIASLMSATRCMLALAYDLCEAE